MAELELLIQTLLGVLQGGSGGGGGLVSFIALAIVIGGAIYLRWYLSGGKLPPPPNSPPPNGIKTVGQRLDELERRQEDLRQRDRDGDK